MLKPNAASVLTSGPWVIGGGRSDPPPINALFELEEHIFVVGSVIVTSVMIEGDDLDSANIYLDAIEEGNAATDVLLKLGQQFLAGTPQSVILPPRTSRAVPEFVVRLSHTDGTVRTGLTLQVAGDSLAPPMGWSPDPTLAITSGCSLSAEITVPIGIVGLFWLNVTGVPRAAIPLAEQRIMMDGLIRRDVQ